MKTPFWLFIVTRAWDSNTQSAASAWAVGDEKPYAEDDAGGGAEHDVDGGDLEHPMSALDPDRRCPCHGKGQRRGRAS